MTEESEFFRKQPRQSRSRALVNAIIGAADELFSKGGNPDDLSLQGVARRAGVGIGSLYDYFASRESILSALLHRVTESNFEALEREVEATEGELSAEQLLARVLAATLRLYLGNPGRTRALVLTVGRLGWMKPIIAERDRFAGVIGRRLLKAYPRADQRRLKLLTELLCDAVTGVVLAELWRERSPDDLRRVEEELLALVTATLREVANEPKVGEAPSDDCS